MSWAFLAGRQAGHKDAVHQAAGDQAPGCNRRAVSMEGLQDAAVHMHARAVVVSACMRHCQKPTGHWHGTCLHWSLPPCWCGVCLLLQVFQQYVQYVREKQGVSQAEEDLVAGLQVRSLAGHGYCSFCNAYCTVFARGPAPRTLSMQLGRCVHSPGSTQTSADVELDDRDQ